MNPLAPSPTVPVPWDPAKVMEMAERSQAMWERGWQSATAGVLFVCWFATLILLLRSQHLRVKDRERADARLDLATEKTALLADKTHAGVAETGKQVLVFSHELSELRREVADATKAIERLEQARGSRSR